VNNFTIIERSYCMHDAPCGILKKLAREAAVRVWARVGDSFLWLRGGLAVKPLPCGQLQGPGAG